MKVTVFGGAGFLGSHVCDQLSLQGYDVTIFDIKPNKYLKTNQKMIINNILNSEAVIDATKNSDYVYNFAGISDIDLAKTNPIETIKYNIIGNVTILEACKINKIKRYIYASSLYVFSDKGSFYRSSKQSAELFIENYFEEFGLEYTILRYGSLYGPRSDENNWINRILKQALLENKITRLGNGEELREYIHVKDAAQSSIEILDKKYKNECIILSGNQQIKISNLLLMIKEILKSNKEIKIEYLPKLVDTAHYNITPYSFKNKMAKKLTRPDYIDLGQGILSLIEHLNEELNKYEPQPI